MLTDTQLDILEKNLQKESDWVIESIGLMPKLKQYGDIQVVGAKKLGLMIAQDIDISVVVPQVNMADWQQLVTKLMVTPKVRKVTAIDYYLYTTDNLFDPEHGQKYSLYIAMDTLMGKDQDKYNPWEIQIHLLDSHTFDKGIIENIMAKLTPQKRITILRLKSWAQAINKELYKRTDGHFKIFSSAIYDAVLEKHIENEHAFLKTYIPIVPSRFKKEFDEVIGAFLNN